MLTADGPVLLECNARLGDPEAQVILPRLAGGARAGHGRRGPRRRPDGPRLGVRPPARLPGRRRRGRAGVEGLPGDAEGAAQAIDGLAAAEEAGALVFHGGSAGRPGGGYGTNGGRVLTVVGRGAGPATGASGGRAKPRTASRGTASSAAATSPRSSRRHPWIGSRWPRDPPLHAPGDGLDLVGRGPVPAHAPRRARGHASPGAPWPRPGGRALGHRGAREGRRRTDRGARAHDRPRRHRLRVTGRGIDRAGGPLPAPRADLVRRRRHRPGPAAARRGRAPAAGRRPAPGRPGGPGARARRHGDDGPDPFGPRRADDVRAEARGLGLRGRPGPAPAGRRRRGDRDRQAVRTGRHVQPPRAGDRGRGARGAGAARRPGQHPDRPARPPRGAADRHRDPRRQPRALRDRDPEPPAHRDRRGPGAVQAGPEGLLGDAPQAQPDPFGARGGSRSRAPRLRGDGAGEPAAVARARHQPLLGRAGDPARTPRSCSTTSSRRSPASCATSSSGRSGCSRTSSAASGSTPRRASCWRWSSAAGISREAAYEVVQRAALAAADQRRPLRELLATDATVARKLSLADLDACFDDARHLTHVPEVIARLEALVPIERGAAKTTTPPKTAAKATADARG